MKLSNNSKNLHFNPVSMDAKVASFNQYEDLSQRLGQEVKDKKALDGLLANKETREVTLRALNESIVSSAANIKPEALKKLTDIQLEKAVSLALENTNKTKNIGKKGNNKLVTYLLTAGITGILVTGGYFASSSIDKPDNNGKKKETPDLMVDKDTNKTAVEGNTEGIEGRQVPTFDEILKNHPELTKLEVDYIKGLKLSFTTDIANAKKDVNTLAKKLKTMEGVIKNKTVQVDIGSIYFSALSNDPKLGMLQINFEDSPLSPSGVVDAFISEQNAKDLKTYKAKYAEAKKAYDMIKDDSKNKTLATKMKTQLDELDATIKKMEGLTNTVELSPTDQKAFEIILNNVGTVTEYKVKGREFLNNLKTTNIAHLRDILDFYRQAQKDIAKTEILWANADAYVAICGKTGKPDMKLWNAIKTNDDFLDDDFPAWRSIKMEYLK